MEREKQGKTYSPWLSMRFNSSKNVFKTGVDFFLFNDFNGIREKQL